MDDKPLNPIPTPDAEPDNADERYATGMKKFTGAVELAILSSHQAAGIDAGPRRYWGSVLFTRLCNASVSILCLCPGSKVNPSGDHWDFSAIASLARNLLDCALYFSYFAVEPVSDDEWRARLKVMQLHDCKERQRMFRALDQTDEQLQGFERQAEELKTILEKNPFFKSLPEVLRRKLLRASGPAS